MTRCFWLAVLLSPLCALASSPLVVVPDRVPQYRDAAEAVRRRLPDAAFVDPQDPSLHDKLKGASVAIAVGQRSLTAAQDAPATTPVVFCMVLGVNKSKLGANVTGVPLEPDPGRTVQQFKLVQPNLRRLALIYDPKTSALLIPPAQRAAAEAGISLVLRPVSSPMEIRDAANGIVGQADAIWLPANPQLITKELFNFLLEFSAERKLPLYGFLDSFTEAGALASVSPDYQSIGQQAASLAAEILQKPEGRRVPPPPLEFAPGKLTINQRTATALGVTISSKGVAEAQKVFQ